MNREEYRKLLASDYWKGYSFSLIKERNFTCEDCGRSFPNERNKLQVHHLVYRDVNPWSYRPEEVVVLCRECHQKRHGIVGSNQLPDDLPPDIEFLNSIYANGNARQEANYDRYESAEWPDEEESWIDKIKQKLGLSKEIDASEIKPTYYRKRRRRYRRKSSRGCLLFFLLLIAALIFLVAYFGTSGLNNSDSSETEQDELYEQSLSSEKHHKVSKNRKSKRRKKAEAAEQSATSDVDEFEEVAAEEANQSPAVEEEVKEKSTSELLDEKIHADVVKQAKKAGVSTEGTTSEILDRITHANVVKQAKKAGVSTEGSTSEILDRITRKNLEKMGR